MILNVDFVLKLKNRSLVRTPSFNLFYYYFRHGDNGYYLFFATTGLKLGNKDPNIGELKKHFMKHLKGLQT